MSLLTRIGQAEPGKQTSNGAEPLAKPNGDATAPPPPSPAPAHDAARELYRPEPNANRVIPGTPPPGEPRTLSQIKRAQYVDPFISVKSKVQSLLAEETNRDRSLTSPEAIKRFIEQLVDSVLLEENLQATRADRARLLDAIAADALGFGPIQALLDDENISEIMVNGPEHVYVERAGQLYPTEIQFDDSDHVMRVIDRIVSPLGRRIDESSPYVDARLPDGSRVNAIIPPISLVGPVVTIRKFAKTPLTVQDLVRTGSMTEAMSDFLKACVLARMNMIVSGGTGSGKTTLLNVLSSFIPTADRIVTIEDAAELQLNQDHLVVLEARPANIEGKGQVTIRASGRQRSPNASGSHCRW